MGGYDNRIFFAPAPALVPLGPCLVLVECSSRFEAMGSTQLYRMDTLEDDKVGTLDLIG